MTERRIAIAEEFSKYPGPRYRHDGPHSGEEFRTKLLRPALDAVIATGAVVTVVLDGVAGYGSSFLEEAFGGLIREGVDPSLVERHLNIVAETPRFQHHRLRAIDYIQDAVARAQAA